MGQTQYRHIRWRPRQCHYFWRIGWLDVRQRIDGFAIGARIVPARDRRKWRLLRQEADKIAPGSRKPGLEIRGVGIRYYRNRTFASEVRAGSDGRGAEAEGNSFL